jgi:Xaa-Pro aminopeptidase
MIDIQKVQSALARERLDGWLLYDFRGQNTIAIDVLQVPEAILTRRWFYFIPAHGEPTAIGHRMEPESVAHLPGAKIVYSDRTALHAGLESLLEGCVSVAMEYSPGAALPTLSRVDKGTVELVESLGPAVVSSAFLIQEFLAILTNKQVASHRRAVAEMLRIKDLAFAQATRAVKSGRTLTEFDLQQFILSQIEAAGMVTDHSPIVAVNANAGKPHYEPNAEMFEPIAEGDLLLIDLWAKEPDGVFADITWTGFLGTEVPERIAEIFTVVAQARDAVVAAIADACSEGKTITGAQADRAARRVITEAGYGDYFIHRTGHSITSVLHGPGANLDDLETEDVRPLLPGLLFSVEPGIYLDDFGIRSEIDVLMTADGPEVTTLPLQTGVLPLLA